METEIDINDQLMDKAIRLSGLKTKKAVVEEALRVYIQMLNQKALIDLGGKLKWEGNLDEMRTNL